MVARAKDLPAYGSLDEEIELWHIFQEVQPIFLQDIGWNYHPQSSDLTVAANEAIQFETFKDWFGADVEKLPGLCPKNTLSKPDLLFCELWIGELLDSLEEFVAAGVVKAAAAGEPPRPRWTDILSWKQFKEFTHRMVTGRTVEAQPTRTESALENPTTNSGKDTNYHKLRALGQLFSQNPKEARRLLKPVQPLRKLLKAREAVNMLRERFVGLGLPYILDATDVAVAKWNNETSRTASAALHDFIRFSTAICETHQAKLQLHGTALDSPDDRVGRDIFLSRCSVNSCSGATGWHHSRFTWLEDDDDIGQAAPFEEIQRPEMITGLCIYFGRDDPPQTWNMKFNKIGFYPSTPRQLPHITSSRAPTMPLIALISGNMLQRDGIFSDKHKAALALSLARCFLHLLHTGWGAQDVWTAEGINFLYQETDTESCIYDIHHPYITSTFLGDFASSDSDSGVNMPASSKPTSTKSQHTLWFFAKLLLDIQTGELTNIDLDDGEEAITWSVWKEINKLQRSGRLSELRRYIQAVHGCVYFTKSLRRYQRGASKSARDSSDGLDDMRRILYTEVIQHLEDHVSFLWGGASKKIISIDLTLPAPTTPGEQSLLTCIEVANDVAGNPSPPRWCSFSSKSLNKAEFASIQDNSEHFLRRFEQFHMRFIAPKMTKERRGTRDRIRIAILDTGICETGSDLHDCIKEVIEYRRSQGFIEDPNAKPKKNPRYPIKERKSFVANDESWVDTSSCGHGTQLACLLLKLVPDADLYIARVSSDMKFAVSQGVLEAMKWAAGPKVKADIITMSFGVSGLSHRLNQGLDIFEKAVGKSGHTPLVFASASNGGLTTSSRSHPASDGKGRVICAYALDGVGNDSSGLNPPLASDAPNFGSLGHGVKVKWNNKVSYTSGTSYAAPILAATAASYLDWLTHYKDQLKPKHEYLWRKDYIERVFKELMNYKKSPEDKMMFIHPENEKGFHFGNYFVEGKGKKKLEPQVIAADAETDAGILKELNRWLNNITE